MTNSKAIVGIIFSFMNLQVLIKIIPAFFETAESCTLYSDAWNNFTTSSGTNQVSIDASTTTSIYLSYTILFDNSPTYYVLRVGQVSASMPIMPTATPNPHGHGLILDTWNELDILNSAGTIPTAFGATTVFELGIVVSRRVTLYGDPVIEDEWLTLPATGTGSFASKYGTTSNIMNTDVFYVDSEPTSPTYQKYFGFLLYKNTRPVDATIKFIQERF